MKTIILLVLTLILSLSNAATISAPGVYRNLTYSGQLVINNVTGVTVEACSFVGGPKTVGDAGAHLIIGSKSSDVWIVGCTFDGSAFKAILIRNGPCHVLRNGVHGSAQNSGGDASAYYSQGVQAIGITGALEVRDNVIEDVGGSGVQVQCNTRPGETLVVSGNRVSRCGQAGIAVYQTRATVGAGGVGRIESNVVVGCDRLEGTRGGMGNGACGIHLNDQAQGTVDPAHPFIAWTVRGNEVYGCGAPSNPRGEDGGGIALDYNADGVTVENNVVHDNYGKAIYVYNADRCVVRGNLCYGNDSGVVISSVGAPESAVGNVVSGNVLWRDYNGPNRGPGYDCEILVFRTSGTLLDGNFLVPAPNRKTVWDMGSNPGLVRVDAGAVAPPKVVEKIVEVKRNVVIDGEITVRDAGTGEVLGRAVPSSP